MPSNIKRHSQLFRQVGINAETDRILGPLFLKPNDDFPTNRDAQIVSGSLHIHNRLLAAGYKPVNPDSLTTEKDRGQILASVAEICRITNSHLEKYEWPQSMRYALLADIVSLAFSLLGAASLKQHLDAIELETFVAPAQKGALVKSGRPKAGFLESFDRGVDNLLLFSRPFLVNLNSQSGKKFADEGARHVHLSFERPSAPFLKTAIGNKLQLFKSLSPGTRLRYKLRAGDPSKVVMPGLENAEELQSNLQEVALAEIIQTIVGRLKQTVDEFNTVFHSTKVWLEGVKRSPTKAQFNNAGSISLAAMGHAFGEQDIAVDFFSHGAMISHGSPDRKFITEVLSRSIYNEPDYASSLLPRSPLQVCAQRNKSKIVSKVRLSGENSAAEPVEANRPFRIYFAPNFLSWFVCFHGMTQSCFEAEYCIRKLVETVSELPDVELYLRIKTTVQDNAKKLAKLPTRGLLPADISDVFDPARGIIDATHGSHQKYLGDADLVVTEGATAVMFEALEHRKPVLFLNRDVSREPSLPSIRLPGPVSQRGACYTAGAMKDLTATLHSIMQHHKDKPLTNTELSSFIWI